MRCTMGLLKLVIVDDEPILLEGLVKTYDWNGMDMRWLVLRRAESRR